LNHFARNIRPFVDAERVRAREARLRNGVSGEFSCLENAHVLGQPSTWHHVRVHGRMFVWSLRQYGLKEGLGQMMQIAGAATKTVGNLLCVSIAALRGAHNPYVLPSTLWFLCFVCFVRLALEPLATVSRGSRCLAGYLRAIPVESGSALFA